MNDDPGALPAETGLGGEPGAAIHGQAKLGPPSGGCQEGGRDLPPVASTSMPAPNLPTLPAPWPDEAYGLPEPLGADVRPRSILFVAWRDLANRRAGGSEVLVDRLASGVLARGHRVTLLCGGPVAERPYRVMRNGGTYSQFLRPPLAYLRHFRHSDLIVDVCNGRPADYTRLGLLLRLWDRVRHVVGGKLVIAGDGPERPRLEALAGPGVVFTGRVSDQERHRLMCTAWLLLHPAMIEGWGIVVAEAAIRGTPAVAVHVPGLRDSVVHGPTG